MQTEGYHHAIRAFQTRNAPPDLCHPERSEAESSRNAANEVGEAGLSNPSTTERRSSGFLDFALLRSE
jgi:hypothetical protein